MFFRETNYKVFPFRFYSFGPLAIKGDGIGEFCPVPLALYGYQRDKAEVKSKSYKIFHNPYVSHVLQA